MASDDEAQLVVTLGQLTLIQQQLRAATARAEKAEALYAKAWAEKERDAYAKTKADAIGRFIRIAERLDDYYMGGNNLRDTLQNIVLDANDAANSARSVGMRIRKGGNQ